MIFVQISIITLLIGLSSTAEYTSLFSDKEGNFILNTLQPRAEKKQLFI